MFVALGYLVSLLSYVLSTSTIAPDGSTTVPVKNVPKIYYFSTESVNAKNAVEKCKTLNMELASILTAEEQKQIGDELKKLSLTSHYWISGHEASKTDPWLWLSNEPITKFYWNKGEPNNAKRNEFCIETFLKVKDGKYVWNDTPCSSKRRYICQAIENLTTVAPDSTVTGGVAVKGKSGSQTGCDPKKMALKQGRK